MNELIERQSLVMQQTINSYRTNQLDLNSLIQRIEGIVEIVDDRQWRNAILSPVFEMEQINADVLNAGAELSEKDKAEIENYLSEIEEFINNWDESEFPPV